MVMRREALIALSHHQGNVQVSAVLAAGLWGNKI